MIIPEVTRIIEAKGTEEHFSTYEANEFFPNKTAQEMGSILRRDERTINVGKRWFRCKVGHTNITMWKVVGN